MNSRSVRKVSDLSFCEYLVDFNEASVHETALNLDRHSCILSCLSVSSVDGKQHLSEVEFSALVKFSLYTTSTHHRVKQSPQNTTGMSSVAYVMLCGARDRSCGQQAIGLHHDNAPAHSSHLIQTSFGENQTFVVRQTPYSPDMASCDF